MTKTSSVTDIINHFHYVSQLQVVMCYFDIQEMLWPVSSWSSHKAQW